MKAKKIAKLRRKIAREGYCLKRAKQLARQKFFEEFYWCDEGFFPPVLKIGNDKEVERLNRKIGYYKRKLNLQ